MNLANFLSAILTIVTFTTTAASPVSSSRSNGSVCGNVMVGYNTLRWEDHNLVATNSCQQLSMSVFLYSIEKGCRCRFYRKSGCNANDRTLDITGPVPAKYANQPYESRWYQCNRV